MTTQKRILIALVAGFAAYFLLASGIYSTLTARALGANDFYSRWVGARELLLHQQNPYADAVTREIQMGMFGQLVPAGQDQVAFAYPIYVTTIIAPFVAFDYAQAQALWMALLVCLVAGSALALLRLNAVPLTRMRLAIGFLFALCFYPSVRGIFNGQISLVSIFLLSVALWAIAHRADAAAGILLAFATMKPQPMILLVPIILAWALAHRRAKILGSMLITWGALAVLGIVLVPSWLGDFIAAMNNYSQYQRIGPPVQTLSEWLIPDAAVPVTCLFGGALLAWLAWRIVQTVKLEWQDFQTTLALAALVTTLTAVRIGTPDQLLLWLPWLMWLRAWLAHRHYGRALLALGICFVLPWLMFLTTLQGNTEHISVVWILPLATLAMYLWREIISSKKLNPAMR